MAISDVAWQPCGLGGHTPPAATRALDARALLLLAVFALSSLLALCAGGAAARASSRGTRATPASVLLRADPFTQLGEKLTVSGELGAGEFGADIALSADGKTAIVGAPAEGPFGAAWIYTRAGSSWMQQGEKLTSGEVLAGGPLPNVTFGASVAISGDGNTVIIGGPGGVTSAGAAWVFARDGSSWTQQGEELSGAEADGAAEFGRSVALSPDGETALVGGPRDGKGVGAAWVFTREGAIWAQRGAKLTGAHEIGHGQFGDSVALSGDGDTALVGARADHSLAGTGAAWVFTREDATWGQQGPKLTGAGETEGGEFGSSVALSEDGATALIGGVADGGGVGAAWAFTQAGSAWAQQGEKLTSGEARSPAHFGSDVALSANGTKALVGADGAALEAGAAWIFASEATAWVRQGEALTGGDEAGAATFGASVALSGEAHTALVGGPQDGAGAGAVWAFSDGTLEELPVGSETDINGGGTPHVNAGGSTDGATEATAARRARGGLSTASASSTRLAALFAHALTPVGPGARIGALLESRAFVASLRAFGPGKAVIVWYGTAAHGAHSSERSQPMLVAAGKLAFQRAGTAAIKVRLTRAGERLLRRAKRLSLNARAMFLPNGAAAIRVSRGFVLKR